MSAERSIKWFKTTFQNEVASAVKNTPFDEDLLAAIAFQETGYIWRKYIDTHSVDEILSFCVGDTLDAPNRSAFPRNRADLERVNGGKQMYKIGRRALQHVAKYEQGYANVASMPNKFCRGYGIFQYDLQFFKTDPNYFLNESWKDFSLCVGNCVRELREAQKRMKWGAKKTLTRREKVHIAIAYNKGTSNVNKGFKQGHRPKGSSKYYGEFIDEYMAIAEGIVATPIVIDDDSIPQPEVVTSQIYRVRSSTEVSLRKRSTRYSKELTRLSPGQVVVCLSGGADEKYWRVEADQNGTVYRGYVVQSSLRPLSAIPVDSEEETAAIDFSNVPDYIKKEIEFPSGGVSNGDVGEKVKRVQEWLVLHGFDTDVDRGFGPATERSLRRFQTSKRLSVSGKVTRKTWDALVKPMIEALGSPPGITTMTVPQAVLAVAQQHLDSGAFELGGRNLGPWVRLYCNGEDGPEWYWCAGFATFMLKQAAYYQKKEPVIEGSVSCDSLARQAQLEGRFVAESDVTSGGHSPSSFGACAIFLRLKRSKDWDHTGICFNFSGSGNNITFDTIEGNTNSEGSRNGGEVRLRTRSVAGKTYDFIKLG